MFEAMFSGKFAEKNDRVTIVDAEPEPFKEMLRFIYTDDVNLKGDNVLRILNLSRKYILEGLVLKCTDYLEKHINPENVCQILNDAIRYNDQSVIDRCLDVCSANTAAVLASESSFSGMTYDALLTFVKHDRLASGQEDSLIRACLGWADRRTKANGAEPTDVRTVLGECVHQIRYLQLLPEAFANAVADTTALTDREKYLFVFSALTDDSTYREALRDLGFNGRSRCSSYERPVGSYTGPYVSQPTMYNGQETIRFSVAGRSSCLLLGVGIFSGGADYQHDVDLVLKEEASDTTLATVQQTLNSSSAGNELSPVYFPEEVRLVADKQYVLKAKTPSNINCYFLASDSCYLAGQFPNAVALHYTVSTYPASYQNYEIVQFGYVKCFHLINTLL